MRKIILLILVLSMVCVSGALAANTGMGKFIGYWEIDLDRTMEEAKKSPKYKAEEVERMPAMIKRIMAIMKVRLTAREMIYIRGGKDIAIPYAIKSSNKKTATVSMKHKGKEATMVFSLRDKDCMNFKTSESSDMDYYIWRKCAAPANKKKPSAIKKSEKKKSVSAAEMKLGEIIIPKVELRSAGLHDALKFLEMQVRAYDPDNDNIKFIVAQIRTTRTVSKKGTPDPINNHNASMRIGAGPMVTLSATKISALEVLKLLVKQTGSSYRISGNTVIISQQ